MLIAHAYKNPSHISHHFATDKGHTFCIHFHTLCVSVCIDMPLYPTLTCKPIGPSKCYEHFISHEKFIRFVLGANMPCLHRLFDMLFLKPSEMKRFRLVHAAFCCFENESFGNTRKLCSKGRCINK